MPLDPMPLAHAGHWLVNALYVLPLVVVVVLAVKGRMRERRARRPSAD